MDLDLNALIYGTTSTSSVVSKKKKKIDESAPAARAIFKQEEKDSNSSNPQQGVKAKAKATKKRRTKSEDSDRRDEEVKEKAILLDTTKTAAATTASSSFSNSTTARTAAQASRFLQTLYGSSTNKTNDTNDDADDHGSSAINNPNPRSALEATLHPVLPAEEPRRAPAPKRQSKMKKQQQNDSAAAKAVVSSIKRKREREWSQIRAQWKRRKYDLRSEVDVGGSIQRVVTEHLLLEQIEEEEEEANAKEQEPETTTTMDAEVFVDTSDEEQQNILKKCFQQPSSSEALQNDKKKNSNNDNDVSVPYAEKLDFWQRGHSAPDGKAQYLAMATTALREELPVEKTYADRSRRSRKKPNHNNDNNDMDNAVLTLSTFPKSGASSSTSANVSESMTNNNAHFPLSHAQYTLVREVHKRQLVKLAARHIVGAAGTVVVQDDNDNNDNTANTDNRFIQALWNADMEDSFRSFLLLEQAGHQGRNLLAMVQHQFCDASQQGDDAKVEVARALGVLPEWHLVGPPAFVGYTLAWNRLALMQNGDRARLLRDHHHKPLPWQPNTEEETTRTRTTRAAIDNSSKKAKPSNKRGKKPPPILIMNTDITYIPVPGAIPPVPSFPLDVFNLVFGPVDKYHFCSHKAPVNHMAYSLTLSSLLARMATAHLEAQDSAKQGLQDELVTVTEHLITLQHNDLIRRLKQQKQQNQNNPAMPVISELPLPALAKAVAAYCSLAANAFPTRLLVTTPANNGKGETPIKLEDGQENDTNDEDNDDPDESSSAHPNDESTRTIFDYFENWMNHNGLQLFSDLHITFGLLQIAQVLPHPSAVALLSRPLSINFDDYDDEYGVSFCPTPLEHLQSILEFLEDEGMLVDDEIKTASSSNSAVVGVGELEYALHQASKSFAKSIERDPTEVSYHAWYIAALAGSLLLCSGNRIGGGSSHCYPSSYHPVKASRQRMYQSFHTNTNIKNEDNNNSSSQQQQHAHPHEIRKMLPKFGDLRQETAASLRLLITLSSHQHGARSHRAVASFLEWKQVVALLVGPVSNNDYCDDDSDDSDPYAAVHSLHDFHVTQWALKENTAASQKYIMQRRRSVCSDSRLNCLARALEDNPSAKAHWSRLATELGTFGECVPASVRQECELSECTECARLHVPFGIDHASRKDRNERGCWWGSDRKDWWDANLLRIAASDSLDRTAGENLAAISSALDSQFEGLETFQLERPSVRDHCGSTNSNSSLQWLEDVEQGLNREHDSSSSVEERNENCDEKLPRSFQEVIQGPVLHDGHHSHSAMPTLQLSSDNLWCRKTEITCYKLIIRGHLYGLLDSALQEGIRQLAVDAWDKDARCLMRDSNAYSAIEYLYKMNLDVPKILLDLSE